MKFFTRNFPLYFTEKKFAKYFCFMYLIIFYNILHFKEGILFYLFYFILFSFLCRLFLERKKKVYKGVRRRSGMENTDLNHFNFASVWLFILSIEAFFPCTLVAQKIFWYIPLSRRGIPGGCFMKGRAHSRSRLRTLLVYLSAGSVTQCARKSPDYRSSTAAWRSSEKSRLQLQVHRRNCWMLI